MTRRTPSCGQAHVHYLMTCDEFATLRLRADNRCELCGLPASDNSYGKLFIDHDGPRWRVRGLLCNRCNTLLGITRPDRLTEDQRRYLTSSWYLGLDHALRIEPATTCVIGRWDMRWRRERDGWLHSRTRIARPWSAVWNRSGPHLQAH